MTAGRPEQSRNVNTQTDDDFTVLGEKIIKKKICTQTLGIRRLSKGREVVSAKKGKMAIISECFRVVGVLENNACFSTEQRGTKLLLFP